MSKLKDLWQSILVLFNKVPKEIEGYAKNALEVTSKIKSLLNHPVVDTITALIPGTIDDAIRAKLLQALEVTIPALQIVDECNDKQGEEMIKCWIENLSRMPKSVQAGLLIKLMALLTAYQDGKELKQNMYDLYAQLVYSKESKKNE